MKKILSLCLLLLLIFTAVTGLTVHANGAAVSIGNATASAGGSFSVQIDLSGNSGFANLGVAVEYDTSVFTLISATGNSNVGAIFTTAQNTDVSPYNMGWDSTSNITYNGNLATLNFAVKDNAASGTYPIKVGYYKGRNGNYTDGEDVNYDENFEPLNLSYVNGNITVSGGSSVPSMKDNISPVSAHYYGAINKIEVDAYLPKDNASYEGYVIAALYDDYGKLIAVHTNKAEYYNHFEFNNMTSNCMAKIMWWDNLKTLHPLAYAKTVVADE